MDELKPCRVCGSKAMVIAKDLCVCSNYSCPSLGGFSFDEWNARPLEDALRAQLEKARLALLDYQRYRDANTLNFQLEKADDFINRVRAELEADDDRTQD